MYFIFMKKIWWKIFNRSFISNKNLKRSKFHPYLCFICNLFSNSFIIHILTSLAVYSWIGICWIRFGSSSKLEIFWSIILNILIYWLYQGRHNIKIVWISNFEACKWNIFERVVHNFYKSSLRHIRKTLVI